MGLRPLKCGLALSLNILEDNNPFLSLLFGWQSTLSVIIGFIGLATLSRNWPLQSPSSNHINNQLVDYSVPKC